MPDNTTTQDQIETLLLGELDTLFSRSKKIESIRMKLSEAKQQVIDMTAALKAKNEAIKAEFQQLSDAANNTDGEVPADFVQSLSDLNAAIQEPVTGSTTGGDVPPATDGGSTDANAGEVPGV